MKVVLLFFCAILGVILLTIILLTLSSIRLNVAKIKISNLENGIKKKKIEKEFSIYFEIYLFGIIKIAKLKLSKKMLNKFRMQENIKDLAKDAEMIKRVNLIEIIKKLKIKLEKIDLELEFGTEEVMLTVFLVAIFSSLLSVAIRNTDYRNVKYSIMPLYQFGNTIKFNLNCIISVKMVHIIYVIYILLKKGMIKNERTSNRRSYDYSYE